MVPKQTWVWQEPSTVWDLTYSIHILGASENCRHQSAWEAVCVLWNFRLFLNQKNEIVKVVCGIRPWDNTVLQDSTVLVDIGHLTYLFKTTGTRQNSLHLISIDQSTEKKKKKLQLNWNLDQCLLILFPNLANKEVAVSDVLSGPSGKYN